MGETGIAQPAGRLASLGRFWTLSNALSLLRLMLAAPIVALVLDGRRPGLMYATIALAIATDWLDGRIARWTNTTSGWGRLLDPLADKVAAGLGALALVVRGDLPLWFLLLALGRDLVIIAGTLVVMWRVNYVPPSNWLGKVTVAALSLTLVAALVRVDPLWLGALLAGTSPLLVLSAAWYVGADIRLLRGGALPGAQ